MALLFSASLYLLSTEEGGRKTAVGSGYRPNWWFGQTDDQGFRMMWAAQIAMDDECLIHPGSAGQVVVRTIGHDEPFHRLAVGDHVDIYEGARKVGVVTIESILLQ